MIETHLSSTEFVMQISALLRSAGLAPDVLSIKNCTLGRNNRTYRIQTLDGSFIIKQYLRQPGDTRDRLAAEFAFLSYAQKVAPQRVPKAFYQEVEQGMALYEYMEGQPLHPQEITAAEVRQAADFFCALNEPEVRAKAHSLPPASEACFSIQEHLALISARIQQLEKALLDPSSLRADEGGREHAKKALDCLLAQNLPSLDKVAMKLISETVSERSEDQEAQGLILRLRAYWQGLVAEISRVAQGESLDLNAPLTPHERCISPSDFGFHNALKMPDGSVCFLDFEYAGWDDPAKMIGDFFSQLALPIPAELFDAFVEKALQPFADPAPLARRAKLLRLVYRVKWCCIALNIFLPVHLARYRFANPSLKVADFKRKQIDKVTHLIQTLETNPYGLS